MTKTLEKEGPKDQKRPFYKNPLFIVVVLAIVIGLGILFYNREAILSRISSAKPSKLPTMEGGVGSTTSGASYGGEIATGVGDGIKPVDLENATADLLSETVVNELEDQTMKATSKAVNASA